MSDRAQKMSAFLVDTPCGHAPRKLIAGDASFRRYERVELDDGEHYIVMDAPPPMEDVRPFLGVTRLLRAYELSAPNVFAQDMQQGFLLLEDFGDASFSRYLREHPKDEERLYLAAAQVLVMLYHRKQEMLKSEAMILSRYDRGVYMQEVALLAEWFVPTIIAQEAQQQQADEAYLKAWQSVLDTADLSCDQPVLRDYHADNLMWLPQRSGVQRVGLLDYQDALLGDSAYDMVSFLEDARRDVSPSTTESVLNYYLRETGQDREDFMRRYAILGAQRNSKIIGIFYRLALRDKKANYLEFLPRVWRCLCQDLEHPALQEVRAWHQHYTPKQLDNAWREAG